jgi:uncharacterized membrane protein
MASSHDELEALRQQVAALTARIFRLEQRLGIAADAPPRAVPQPYVPPAAVPQAPPIAPLPGTLPPAQHVAASSTQTAARPESGNLESKIGKVWLNYIGIGAIFVGTAFFMGWAIDNDKIGHPGQVAIGLIVGILVVLWSERFRRKGHKFFSYSLKAVGIGIMYLSLWGAHYYKLIPVEVAFAAMILVTAATVTLAVTQDAQILAFYALIGGFVSPVLVSTGKNEEVVLFSYVAILDLGVLALAALKPWRRLLWGAFIGTILMYVGWYDWADFYTKSERPTTVFFASLFAAIFAAIPLVTPYRRSGKFPGPSITLTVLPMLNAALYFLALYAMYSDEVVKLTWFALGLAAVYLVISNLFMRRFEDKAERKVISLLHVAIAIAFITIAVPLKLNAHWITIGWLIESFVLLWIGAQTKTAALRYLGTTTLVLGIFRVFVFDSDVYTTTLIFNVRFATYAVALAVLGAIIFFGERALHLGKTEQAALKLAEVVFNVMALVALTLEAHDYFTRQMTAPDTYGRNWELYSHLETVRNFTYSIIWLIYGAGLMVAGFWKRSAFVRWQALVLIAFTIGKISIFDSKELDTPYRIMSFIALGVALLGISFAYQRDWLKLSGRSVEKSAQGTSA